MRREKNVKKEEEKSVYKSLPPYWEKKVYIYISIKKIIIIINKKKIFFPPFCIFLFGIIINFFLSYKKKFL